jgi:hypothetical protein
MPRARALFLIGTVLFLLPPGGRAEDGHAKGEELRHQRTLYNPNAISAFVGATSGKEGTDLTLGVEYLRHLDGRVAIGLTGEVVLGDDHERAWLLVLTADYVIAHEWILFFGPGVEFLEQEDHGTEREMFARFGIDREFVLPGERIAIAPTLALDVFPHEVKWVWGVLVGFGW